MNAYLLRTLGCKANLYDSQWIEQDLQNRGWLPSDSTLDDPKLCIINSCTVTDEADRQTRKLAAKLAKDYPQSLVVVTGCAAEVDPNGLARAPGVAAVIGNQDKNQFVNHLIDSHILNQNNPNKTETQTILGSVTQYTEILSRHPQDREWPAATDSFQSVPGRVLGQAEKTRSFLKIQEGCNTFCTYCIIPYGRGPRRSLKPHEIIRQIQALILQGTQEVILTGTNLGDYGLDWGGSEQALGELLTAILSETAIKRLRISSLDPTEITPQILSLMEKESSRFCPHFHVSLQSPHSRILRLMKRKYSFEEVQTCLRAISQLHTKDAQVGGVFVGMDMITGFPGETEEEFEWTYETLRSLPWTRLHVFPYSERKGTPATRLPGTVPQATRKSRAKKLRQLSMERLTQHYQTILLASKKLNQPLNAVLLEKASQGSQGSNEGWCSGYTPNYLRVLIRSSQAVDSQNKELRNTVVSAEPLDIMLDSAAGDVAFIARVFNPGDSSE